MPAGSIDGLYKFFFVGSWPGRPARTHSLYSRASTRAASILNITSWSLTIRLYVSTDIFSSFPSGVKLNIFKHSRQMVTPSWPGACSGPGPRHPTLPMIHPQYGQGLLDSYCVIFPIILVDRFLPLPGFTFPVDVALYKLEQFTKFVDAFVIQCYVLAFRSYRNNIMESLYQYRRLRVSCPMWLLLPKGPGVQGIFFLHGS